ncbi:MAG: hypothetical protein HGB15_00685 [Chlorobaculum sp.]|nr:hypothetical protein [Chlorobaculum sp.]
MNTTYSTRLRRMTALALLYAFVLSPLPARAADSFEELLDRSESEGNAETLFSDLEDLRRNKIPVNLATEEQLLELPLLSAADAARIIDWRRMRGPIGSASGLEAVIGADAARRLSPYLSYEMPREEKKKGSRGRLKGSVIGRAFWESPPRAGIESGKYAGENRRVYSRVQAATPHYGVHLLQESDIGEPRFDDFLSFNVHAEKIGVLSRAVVGDYRLSFGQGLLFGQGRYFSKGSDAIDGVLLFAPTLRPYTSAGENYFLQGAAATLSPEPFEVTAFTSSNKLDASIDAGVVTSISTSGYHRTVSEIAKKDTLTERVNGVNLRYRYRTGELSAGIGATLAEYRYTLPINSLGGKHSGQLGSLEASAVYRHAQLFGEAAFDRNSDAMSWICGVQADLARGVTGVASMREYTIGYYSPFAGAFAERGDGSNEEGFYLGLKAKALNNLNLAASYDIFRFPELDPKYYALPSSGHDARLYVTWKQNRWIIWDGMYQHKEKEETKKQLDPDTFLQYYKPVPKTTNRVQLGLTTLCSSSITLKSRAAIKSIRSQLVIGTESEEGWLLYQQLNWKSGPVTLKTRLARFDTDSYDAGLYAFEDDLPLVFTLNNYYGRGKAWFILLDYEPVKDFSLTAKYETTWYNDREVYGSGNDLRNTSSPSSFNVGCMWKF